MKRGLKASFLRTVSGMVAFTLLLPACQHSSPPTATTSQESEPTSHTDATPPSSPESTDSKSPALQPSTTEVPADFPLPIYAGLKVVGQMTTEHQGRKGIQIELTGDISSQEVADFYEQEFKKRGLEVRRGTAHAQSDGEVLLLGQSPTITAGLMITTDNEGKKRVILSWSEQRQ